jgi:hypothetical protein
VDLHDKIGKVLIEEISVDAIAEYLIKPSKNLHFENKDVRYGYVWAEAVLRDKLREFLFK